MRPVIVIPGDDPPQIQGSSRLEQLGAYGEVQLYRDRPRSVDEQLKRAAPATCLINSRGAVKWSGDLLRQLPNLKMITVCGIGTDAIDLEAARARGIAVCNLPGKTAPIVAEHAFALMLAVARRAWSHTDALKRGRWAMGPNISLRGKTLGLIGTGAIGGEMARLCAVLGMRTLAWTFNPSAARAARLGVTYVALPELLQAADVVSLHVRLSPQTRGLLGHHELGSLKPGAIVVNTARGALIDTAALAEALRDGRLGGAGIDVFEPEPVPVDHPLLRCEQVVLTPHNADQTPEGIDLLNEGVVENVIAFLSGSARNRVV